MDLSGNNQNDPMFPFIQPNRGEDVLPKPDKSRLSLDFSQASRRSSLGSDSQNNNPCFLDSPDMQMLKVGSPELEKMILESYTLGNGSTTPTPTSLIEPRLITSEVDSSIKASHIVDAPQYRSIPCVVHSAPSGPSQHVNQSSINEVIPTSSTNKALPISEDAYEQGNIRERPAIETVQTYEPTVKSEPTFDELDRDVIEQSGSMPFPVIQEQIKQERKRLRNRIAATKCRRRKLEKISTLEDQVKELKRNNSDLNQRKYHLKEQIASLKQKVMTHLKNGCQVHVGSNMPPL